MYLFPDIIYIYTHRNYNACGFVASKLMRFISHICLTRAIWQGLATMYVYTCTYIIYWRTYICLCVCCSYFVSFAHASLWSVVPRKVKSRRFGCLCDSLREHRKRPNSGRLLPIYSRGGNSYDSVLHLVAIVSIQTNPRVICVGTRSSRRTQQPRSGSKDYSNHHVIYTCT